MMTIVVDGWSRAEPWLRVSVSFDGLRKGHPTSDKLIMVSVVAQLWLIMNKTLVGNRFNGG